ncbi:class I SAM-dependent methyltransferase [Paraburkholderia sp. BCC1885]|uniref:class I SAM-dependent methyltransferase n=1 Tax=Paraburkholderia sp. BCC1885 TaxID=2562669 RepID=UPI00164343C1|nr:class I SAM-dependent methyltransferase [Paraburkholderia sp. BCC1885]
MEQLVSPPERVDDFYRAFEDVFRGPRELIKSRLAVYLPFVEPLLSHFSGATTLDLGCGRGEWLELMREIGFKARGVDLDENMLTACHRAGLNVENRDALEALRALPDECLAIVSAFHVVEHIGFDDLRTLVSEAKRVLLPGGLLVLETPNPENIVVASRKFYLDPSHFKPIPSELLGFVAQYSGFARVRAIGLQENEAIRSPNEPVNLMQVLDGVSPDYAVVAQKAGPDAVFECNAEAFRAEYGLTLHALTERYSSEREERTRSIELRAQQLEASLHWVAVTAAWAVTDQFGVKVREVEATAQRAEARSCETRSQLEALYGSASWRITAPLRRAEDTVRHRYAQAQSGVSLLLQHAALYVGRRPRLKRATSRVLGLTPGLKARLQKSVKGVAAPEISAQDDSHGSNR